MITLRASPASTASTEADHPTKSLFSGSRTENATALAEQVGGWDDDLWDFFLGFSHWFSRADVRWQAWKYLRGLMAPIERRSGWSLAEHAGDATPDKMQGLLVSRCLDRDKLRDEVRSALVAAIGDEAGVLVADETGFIKKGRSSAGVQRQYTGTTGKIDNCQLGVFLTYHTRHGRAHVDRELYLPKSWTDDRDRCRRAHIGDDVPFGYDGCIRLHQGGLTWPHSRGV
ncbi:DDE superfamily endonuclease [Actinoplanes derwentensis]|uniref:DDE superfamily endonuclease n=1 Tax=Actinoplanes derwentensis TaxID=113562 RepID=A0A1H2DD27_9ACTN|nr:DDE superfamily endonuclease [Actinoplanes derwentensis]